MASRPQGPKATDGFQAPRPQGPKATDGPCSGLACRGWTITNMLLIAQAQQAALDALGALTFNNHQLSVHIVSYDMPMHEAGKSHFVYCNILANDDTVFANM